jgi:general secretion pathway protein J
MIRAHRRAFAQPWRGSAGFTLVEAVVATALMAIIIGVLATITAQWLPNWNRGFARLQGSELFAAGLDRVLADLAAAEFLSMGNQANAPLAFDGRELAVTFVRTTLGPNTMPGLEIVRLAESTSEGAPALVRSTAPFLPNNQDSRFGEQLGFTHPVVVIRAPFRVSFSYAGPDRVWRDTWRGESILPRTIRVRVRDAASSRTLAVSATAIVRAELPARCVVARTNDDCPMLRAGGG